MPQSVWVSKQLNRPVIKAFNNILAHSLAELGRPAGSPGRLAIAVAGDDVRSKQIVMEGRQRGPNPFRARRRQSSATPSKTERATLGQFE